MKKNIELNEKMFELRKQGMSYRKIREELLKQYGASMDLRKISLICKQMFKERGIEEPIYHTGRKERWNQGEQAQKMNDEIYKLKEQGFNNTEITKKLNEKGIEIKMDKVARLCRNIYAEKGRNIPRIAETSPVDREYLYSLAERGISNNKILKMLKEQGIEITESKIRSIMQNIYEEKGIKRTGGRQKRNVTAEEVYNLKMQGKSCKEISKYFEAKGIEIGETAIYKKAKKIFNAKGEEIPKAENNTTKRNNVPESCKEKIVMLRDNKVSIREIREKIQQEDGLKLSRDYIEKLLENVYTERGEEQPKAKVGAKRKRFNEPTKKKNISFYDEELYNLKEQGYGIKKISEILKEKYDYTVSASTVNIRLKKIYESRGEKKPRTSKSQRIEKQVSELREQGLNYNEIAQKIKTDVGETVNEVTVRKICQSIYGKATRKEIAEIGRLKRLEEELNSLEHTKQESEKLLEQYKELQNIREEEQNERE